MLVEGRGNRSKRKKSRQNEIKLIPNKITGSMPDSKFQLDIAPI